MLPISEMKHLNQGECADIYEVDAKTVLKLSKPGWNRDMLYQEYLNGKAISGSGVAAPGVYDFVEIGERYGYTMDKLKDVTLLDMMWKYPWRIVSYSKKLAALHAQIHSTEVPDGLQPLTDMYGGFISAKQNISEKRKKELISDIERLNAGSTKCICHGDFHAMNVLVEGGKYSVIDWVLASEGNPEADVAGTYLITREYSRCSQEKNFLKRFIGAVGGRICAEIYLKKYISITGMDKQKIFSWIPARAATYVDVGLPEKLDRICRKIAER